MLSKSPKSGGKAKSNANALAAGLKDELAKDPKLHEEIRELQAFSDRKDFSRADTEVREALSKATQTDIRNTLLLDQGRCPACHSRTENFLFTTVCPSCGWFRREVPSKGRSIVNLRNGDKVVCDYVHHGRHDEILCIRAGVVVSEIMRSVVQTIDHVWEPGELEEARSQVQRTKTGICSWCNTSMDQTPLTEHGEDYVAFGAFQERYVFCSEKCQRAFRRHYPPRVHRNCYEVDCNSCDLCIKRYDTNGFKRNILH